MFLIGIRNDLLCCIPKILKNESNSQHHTSIINSSYCCVVSQRYWKMKAIHNNVSPSCVISLVVLYPKDTEKWKQFTTIEEVEYNLDKLCCIPKILKNESNSQHSLPRRNTGSCCVVSQRYWKMKAIHNGFLLIIKAAFVVLYPKDTEKWKQFTTILPVEQIIGKLCCIPKILKNESNSQQ